MKLIGKTKLKFESLFQKRIANTSVGASTVRGQKKGTAKTIREYLENINLGEFKKINNQTKYDIILDKHTNKLANAKHKVIFGFARKCLNIFLFEVSHNTILSKKWGLNRIIPFLELPIDNPNEKRLRKGRTCEANWNWSSINKLGAEDNEKIQEFARKYMKKEYGLDRVYFELYSWRSEK